MSKERETTEQSIKNKNAWWQIPLCIAGVGCLSGIIIYNAGISAATNGNTNVAKTQTQEASNTRTGSENYIETLGQYKGLTTQTVLQSVTDENVDAELKAMSRQLSYTTPVEDRAAQAGDVVSVEYIQGNSEDAEPAAIQFEVGAGTYPEAFENAVIGHKAEEKVEVDLDDGNGGMNNFNITITKVETYRDADDELAAKLGIDGVNNLEDLKKLIRAQLEAEYQNVYNEQAQADFIKQLHDSTTFKEIPKDVLDPKVAELKEKLNEMAASYSTEEAPVTINDIVTPTMQQEGFVGTVDDYLVYYVTNTLQNAYMFRGVYDAENLDYSQAELYSLVASDWINVQSDYPTLLSYVDSTDITTYEDQLVNLKAMEFITENSESDYKAQ